MVHAVDDSTRCLRLGLEAGRIDIKIYVVHTLVHSVYLVTHHHKVSLTKLQRLGGKHGVGSATLHANLHLVSIVCGSEEHATQLCGGYAFCDDRLLGSRLKRQRIYIALRTRLHIDKGREIYVSFLYSLIVVGEAHMQVLCALCGSEAHALAVRILIIAGIS